MDNQPVSTEKIDVKFDDTDLVQSSNEVVSAISTATAATDNLEKGVSSIQSAKTDFTKALPVIITDGKVYVDSKFSLKIW